MTGRDQGPPTTTIAAGFGLEGQFPLLYGAGNCSIITGVPHGEHGDGQMTCGSQRRRLYGRQNQQLFPQQPLRSIVANRLVQANIFVVLDIAFSFP